MVTLVNNPSLSVEDLAASDASDVRRKALSRAAAAGLTDSGSGTGELPEDTEPDAGDTAAAGLRR